MCIIDINKSNEFEIVNTNKGYTYAAGSVLLI